MTLDRRDPPIGADFSVREIVDHLTGHAVALCHFLLPNGRREGAEWRVGSVQGEAGKSLGVHLAGEKIGIWSDFAGGSSGDLLDLIQACQGLDKGGAVSWAKDWLSIGDGTVASLRPWPRTQSNEPPRQDNSNGRLALEIWHASQPAAGTLVETYLRARRIVLPVPATLRYHPGLLHSPTGLVLPAMVAAVTNWPSRDVTGVLRTFLRMDGGDKAPVSEPKMTLGPLGVGAVRLAPAQPAIGLAEGIETALSAMQLFEISVWAALGSRMDRVELPEEVIGVHVFGDNGKPGHDAAEKAAATFTDQGRRVALRFPPPEFGDWNNALQALNKEFV